MAPTNAQALAPLLLTDKEVMEEALNNGLHQICDKYIEKNLSPTNPACEGRWCEQALEIWLDQEAIGDE